MHNLCPRTDEMLKEAHASLSVVACIRIPIFDVVLKKGQQDIEDMRNFISRNTNVVI